MDGWKLLPCGGHDGLVARFHLNQSFSYEFTLSDLSCVWTEHLSAEKIKQRCSELNPRLEAPLTNVLEHIRKSFDTPNPDALSVVLEPSCSAMVALQNQFLGSIPFKWTFKCRKSEDGCQDVFLSPFVKLVASLQLANSQLMEIIQKKDDEIKDYKEFSGVKVSRPYLETTEFRQDEFLDKLRRSNAYKQAIQGNIVSIITSPLVNDNLSMIKGDFINPLPSLPGGNSGTGPQANIKSRLKNRRLKNKRSQAKGVGAMSDSGSESNEEPPRAKSSNKKPAAIQKGLQKKKKIDKRKKLF